MNGKDFVEAIREHLIPNTIKEVMQGLEKPPGRVPAAAARHRSEKYYALEKEQQEFCEEVVREAVEAAVFGVLCVLDGVRQINQELSESTLRLVLEKTPEKTAVIADNQGSVPLLHEFF